MSVDEMLRTATGEDVKITTRSILYICDLSRDGIEVIRSIQFPTQFEGLNAYANIHNPESQLISADNYDDLIKDMHTLHGMMKKDSWLESLRETI